MIKVRRGEPGEVIDLRHTVLRAGLARETAVFPGDDEPGTVHVVAVESGRIIGCATMLRSAWDGRRAWQVRGMAVVPGLRGRGVGGLMLEELIRLARVARGADAQAEILWCNARTSAVGFYEKNGWTVVSEPFEIETAGPHVKMTRPLAYRDDATSVR